MVDKWDFAQIHYQAPWILQNLPFFSPVSDPVNLLQTSTFHIVMYQLPERLFPFSLHHSEYFRKSLKNCRTVIRYFGASDPDWHSWKNLSCLPHKLLYIIQIPDITGKAKNIRFLPVQIHQNIIYLLVDRILRNLYLFPIFRHIRPKTVHGQIGMDVFRIDRC